MDIFDAAIVGGGHNGLACAALLAKAGLSVVVLERSESLGGAATSDSLWNGFTISAASYVCSLLDPALIEELQLERHGYHAYRKDPSNFSVTADGQSLLLSSDDEANAQEIAAFDRADIDGYAELDRVLHRLGSELFETFAEESPRFDALSQTSRELMSGSAADIVEKYVRTPILGAAVATDGTIGTYRGPRDAGTGYVLAHHSAGRALGVQGAWGYVRGGMGAISAALASAARTHGATIVSNTRVAHLNIVDGRTRGVVLDDGREIAARTVISNAHPRTTFLDLVGKQWLDDAFVAKLDDWQSVGPSFKLNLALGELPNFRARPGNGVMPHHHASIHIAPSIDYVQRAFHDAKTDGASHEPMLECFLQTATDETLAPAGKHILSIFAQYYPYDRADGWDRTTAERIADDIVALIGMVAPNVPGAVEHRQILSPADLEQRFGLVGGHIFHGELVPEQIFEYRFGTRTPVQNLYLCGSGAHPGGCVSGFPGRRAAAAVIADLRSRAAKRTAATKGDEAARNGGAKGALTP